MSRFVQLPVSRVVIDLDTISFIGQVDLNKYNVFFKFATPAFPTIEGKDLDALIGALKAEKLSTPPELATA